MHRLQPHVADDGALKASRTISPNTPRKQLYVKGIPRRSVLRSQKQHHIAWREKLPPVCRSLPVDGKNCKTRQAFMGPRLYFNLWCMHAPRFWCKVLESSPPWPLKVGGRWRPLTPFKHFFCFSPKLTTYFIRSRLGGVPPSRPLVYLLDGI